MKATGYQRGFAAVAIVSASVIAAPAGMVDRCDFENNVNDPGGLESHGAISGAAGV